MMNARLRCHPRTFRIVRKRAVTCRALQSFRIEQTLRKHIVQLKPYTPIEPFEIVAERIGKPIECIIKLDANENLYGPPPEVLEALGSMKFAHIYPDPESRQLREKLAIWTGVPKEHLMVGCGADELIDLLLRCVLEDGDRIIDCPPTFPMYDFDIKLNNGQNIEVLRNPDFSIDLPSIKKAIAKYSPKAIFLTSPNNPDGSVLNETDLLEILNLPILVVLDEAYQEFTNTPSKIDWVQKYPNLVVLRTFSKCAALAGIRVGYGAFPLELASYIWRAKQPYNVSVAAEVAACAALSNPDYMKRTRDLIVNERRRLYELLQTVSFLRPFPSESNFILCKVIGRGAKALKEALYREGVLIRHYNTNLLDGFVRISVGKPEHTDALITALRNVEMVTENVAS